MTVSEDVQFGSIHSLQWDVVRPGVLFNLLQVFALAQVPGQNQTCDTAPIRTQHLENRVASIKQLTGAWG
jgi:hypothetical protein